MRIAWITPYLPWPINSGGRIRITRLAEGLASEELHLFSYLAPDDSEETAGAHDWPGSPFAKRHWFPADGERARHEPFLPSAATRLPRALCAELALQHQACPFDVAIVEHSYAAGGLSLPPGLPFVLDEHNIESDYHRRMIFLNPEKRLRYAVEYAAWWRFERTVWQRAGAVAVVSTQDQEKVGAGATVVANGVNVAQHRFLPPSARRGFSVLFVGHMQYGPNIAAAQLLAQEVLPRLRTRVPQASLTIAGRAPQSEILSLENPSVRIVENPENIAELYANHDACAIPLKLGAGTSLKTLEPLAAGMPLFASELGARGFGLVPDRHYLRAESAGELAAGLCRLFFERERFDAMAERGRRVAESFDWSHSAARFAEVVKGIVRPRAPL